MMALTPKQARFVDEYLIDLNGAQAAIRAGYSAKTAKEIAVENLTKPLIAQAVQERMKARSKRTEITQDSVLRELAAIVHADPRKAFDENGNLLPVNQWPDEVAAMIASIEVNEIGGGDSPLVLVKKIKLWDKNSAIDKAMKHLGQFERDNSQKNIFAEMSDDALKRFIAKKSAELGIVLH